MAKNESFHDIYVIEIKGKSTNRFVPDLINAQLVSIVKAINTMYQQSDATINYTNLKEAKKHVKDKTHPNISQ